MTNPNDPNWQQPYPGGYGADPYGQQYPAQYGPGMPQPGPYGYGYGQPSPPGTNGLAIASLVTSAVGLVTCLIPCLVGAILGHVALGRIKQSGQPGRGLALAGVIIGWLGTTLLVVLTIAIIVSLSTAVDGIEGDPFQPV
jgi:hypothetical protein